MICQNCKLPIPVEDLSNRGPPRKYCKLCARALCQARIDANNNKKRDLKKQNEH